VAGEGGEHVQREGDKEGIRGRARGLRGAGRGQR
jgi:hypothetical protein